MEHMDIRMQTAPRTTKKNERGAHKLSMPFVNNVNTHTHMLHKPYA